MGRVTWPPWCWYLVVVVISVIAYFRTPDSWVQTICYDAIAASGAIAMMVGVRMNRPVAARLWIMFAACQLIAVCGDFTYAWYARALHDASYPAPADAFYLIAVTLEAVTLILVLRRRLPARDIAGIIEAMILAGACPSGQMQLDRVPVKPNTSWLRATQKGCCCSSRHQPGTGTRLLCLT